MSQLKVVIAVAQEGGFQAGAKKIHRSHPSLVASIKNLESELGFLVFSKKEYRAKLTEEGKVVYKYARSIMSLLDNLKNESLSLRQQPASKLSIVVGSIVPIHLFSDKISQFIDQNSHVKINIETGTVNGPFERLESKEVDLVCHVLDDSKVSVDMEYKCLAKVKFIPVISSKLIEKAGLGVLEDITYQDLLSLVQCVIKDTGTKVYNKKEYFILEGAKSITVQDEHLKKELIKSGAAWGHLPDFLIKDELHNGNLVSLENKHIVERELKIALVRLRKKYYRPEEDAIWNCMPVN